MATLRRATSLLVALCLVLAGREGSADTSVPGNVSPEAALLSPAPQSFPASDQLEDAPVPPAQAATIVVPLDAPNGGYVDRTVVTDPHQTAKLQATIKKLRAEIEHLKSRSRQQEDASDEDDDIGEAEEAQVGRRASGVSASGGFTMTAGSNRAGNDESMDLLRLSQQQTLGESKRSALKTVKAALKRRPALDALRALTGLRAITHPAKVAQNTIKNAGKTAATQGTTVVRNGTIQFTLDECISRCMAMRSWKPGKKPTGVLKQAPTGKGKSKKKSGGDYNETWRNRVEAAKGPMLRMVCTNGCNSGLEKVGNTRTFVRPRGSPGILPAGLFAIAKSKAEKVTRVFKPVHASNLLQYKAAWQSWEPWRLKFELHTQLIKVLQCATPESKYRTCCDTSTPGGRTFFKNALNCKKHVGEAACNKGHCWDWQSPPVACDVKKATYLHKICMTHSQKRDGRMTWGKPWVKDTRSEKLRCWFPMTQPKSPRPFSKDGVADWRTKKPDGSHGLVKYMNGTMRDSAWGCGTGLKEKNKVCSTSEYGTDNFWLFVAGLSN